MRTKLNGLLTLLLAFVVQFTFAQDKTVSGNVTDSDGLPLPGVNIVVEGTTNGTQTDFDGNYSISASAGQVLLFSYIGQKDERRTVAAGNTINVQMSEDAQALEEVVVTALGIQKEKKALGYAVSEVDETQLESRPTGDLGRVLNGKASGLQINNQSGLAGSGTNVVIRGATTFAGSNQALFIVDGVPFNSDTQAADVNGQNFAASAGSTSRFLDLDPNSIESVNILKGLAAATLYGTQGRNGVVLITTKGGSAKAGPKKTEVTVTSSFFVNEIASLPDYQNEFGNGFDQAFGLFFSNFGPSFSRNNPASFENDPSIRASDSTIPHPYSTANPATGIPAAFPEFADARYEYIPYNNVGAFFRQGGTSTTNINVRGGSDDGKYSFNVNYGYLDELGFTPGNGLIRNTLGVGGRAKLSNKFTVSGTLNYARTSVTSPPVAPSLGNGVTNNGSSVFGDLFFTPRSIDIQGLPFQNPVTGGSVYYRNGNDIQHPLWTVNNAGTENNANRVFGQATVQYEFNDNISLVYRAGVDFSSEFQTNFQNAGGVNGDIRLQSGILQTSTNDVTIFDHNLVLNGNYDLGSDIGFAFNVGGTTRRNQFVQNGLVSDGQQVFNVLRHFNFLNTIPIQFTSSLNIAGLYASLDFDYDDWIFLSLQGRNDWVSNFSPDNRSQFYPSASVSFLPTEIIDGLKGDVLNYLKIRGGIGTSANFDAGNSFPVANTLNLSVLDFQDDAGNTVVTNSIGNRLGNPNLQPETLEEIEVGIESRWWDNRINFNASVFRRTTNDLIVDQPLDPATGFTITSTNIGEIQADGVEFDVSVDWFRAKNEGDFSWNSSLNFTSVNPIVTDLGQGDDSGQIVFAGFGGAGPGNAAVEGETLGAFFGSRVARDENDNFIVQANGTFLRDPEDGVIGDPVADFTTNLINSFSYKNFTFGFQWNYQQGGEIFSSTVSTLLGRGLIPETVDRLNTFILPGVTANPDGSFRENDLQINNSTFFFTHLVGGNYRELQVYDATTIRLQEVSLAYNIPSRLLDRTPFGGLTFTLSGRNLFFDAVNIPDGANFDPNVNGVGVGNSSGLDFLSSPSGRSYGVSVRATF